MLKACPQCGGNVELVKEGPFWTGRCFPCAKNIVIMEDDADRIEAIDLLMGQLRDGAKWPAEHVLMIYGFCIDLLKEEIKTMRKERREVNENAEMVVQQLRAGSENGGSLRSRTDDPSETNKEKEDNTPDEIPTDPPSGSGV